MGEENYQLDSGVGTATDVANYIRHRRKVESSAAARYFKPLKGVEIKKAVFCPSSELQTNSFELPYPEYLQELFTYDSAGIQHIPVRIESRKREVPFSLLPENVREKIEESGFYTGSSLFLGVALRGRRIVKGDECIDVSEIDFLSYCETIAFKE